MTETTTKEKFLKLSGTYSIGDIKYDLLKIIEPYDGYMFNKKDTERVQKLFESYLNDLKSARKIVSYNVYYTVKDPAITFDVAVKINHDRAQKKLKIHVARLNYTSPKLAEVA